MLYRVKPKRTQPFRPLVQAGPQILHRGVEQHKTDRHSWEKNTVCLITEGANWRKVVNTGFLKAWVSCEIPILTCMICLSLSLMKKKGRKLLPWKEAQNQQASSRRSFFKMFSLQILTYMKKINTSENYAN